MSSETSTASASATEASTHDTAPEPSEGSGGSNGDGDGDGGRFASDAAVNYLKWAAVAVLAVTALVALFGFYTGVSRVITVWVSRPYRPVVNATFNLALLLAALGGIGLLLRGRD